MKSLATLILLVAVESARAQGTTFTQETTFTYQGRLSDGSAAANGVYDLRFAIFDALANGNAVGRAVTNAATTVTDGLFTVTLDFGAGVFTGPPRWLEIGVRTNDGASFATLAPRQPLTPSPYAVFATSASSAAIAENFKGAIADGQLSANIPRLNSSAAFSGSVTAGGLNVTGATTLGPLGGNLRLSNFDLLLRGDPDPNHGLGWYGSDTAFPNKLFAGQALDGPVLYGYSAGGLGTTDGGQNLALTWSTQGNVAIDPLDRNDGALGPGLLFGELGSGEGIASKRTKGGNRYGLDFYTGYAPRLSIANNGNVGIGTVLPDRPLAVQGYEWMSFKNPGGSTAWHLNNYLDGLNFAQTGLADARLFLSTNNGAVGIGTATPQQKLHVIGNILAIGTITAESFVATAAGGIEPPSGVTPILAMVWIKPGTFVMGSPNSEAGRNGNEGPQTVVTLTKGFWMGHHEVTQGEYLSLMNTNPSYFSGDLNRPVEQVNWNDATNYCRRLTQGERTAGRLPAGWGYRLPTEAEWEYACRAWSTTQYSYGDDPGSSSLRNFAWYWNSSGATTHPVGQRIANPWGLMDMHGNVEEWCQNYYYNYPGGNVTDPQGPGSGVFRVIRGGNWYAIANECRSAYRSDGPSPPYGSDLIGFRVVLAPGQP